MTSVLPVSLSSTFWDRPERRDSAGLHALRHESDAGFELDGSNLRVDVRTGQLQVAQDDGTTTMQGKMKDVDELDCVLLWDEEAKSYTLHRLSTSTTLSGSGSLAVNTPKAQRHLSATRSPAMTTSKVSTTAHLSPRPDALLRSSASPSPRPPQLPTLGLGISAADPSSAIRPQVGRKGVPPSATQPDVETFDNDLASASEDSDNDIDFDDGLALPPSQAPVPTPGTYSYSPAAPNMSAIPANALSFGNNNTGVVSSDEDDENEEDEGDFDDLANDLEVSLAPIQETAQAVQAQAPIPAPAAGPRQQQQATARKTVPSNNKKARDSDIASSSESDDDSGSEA